MMGQKNRDASIPVVVPVKISIVMVPLIFANGVMDILESLASISILDVKLDYCFALVKIGAF